MFKRRSEGDDPYREIARRVWQLGNQIQKFAEDHYSLQMSENWEKAGKKPKYRRYLQLTTPESPKYRNYLEDAAERPKVVGGFVWRVLVFELFECFHWLGARTGRNLLELREQLRPAELEDVNTKQYKDQLIRFNAWSGATVELLGEIVDDHQEQEAQLQREYEERKKRYIATNILATIGHGSDPYKTVLEDLIQLVQRAWALDVFLTGYKEITLFEWKWGAQPTLTGPREAFNPVTDVDWDDRENRSGPLVEPGSPKAPKDGIPKAQAPSNILEEEPQPENNTAANTTKPRSTRPPPLDLQSNTNQKPRHIRMVCSPALVRTSTDFGDRLDPGSEIFYLKRAVSLTPGDDPNDERLDTSLQVRFLSAMVVKDRKKRASLSGRSSGTATPTRSFTVPAHWGNVVGEPHHPGSQVGLGYNRPDSPYHTLAGTRSPGPLSPGASNRPTSPMFEPGIIRRASGLPSRRTKESVD